MSPTLSYEDFEVEVSRGREGGLEVRVLRSLTNRPRSSFELPWTPEDARDLVVRLSNALEKYLDRRRESKRIRMEPKDELGRKLFQALFPQSLLRTLDSNRGEVGGRSRDGAEVGLRLRLSFETAEGVVEEVAALPWELLWDRKRFLARDRETPVVRYIDAEEPIKPFTVEPPLRVLLVGSSPQGEHPLNLASEVAAIRKAAVGHPWVAVEEVKSPTLDALRERLYGEPVHVLHFMGHGGFRPEQGFVLFEDVDRGGHPVTDRVLAEIVPEANSLRLVVLTSCKTGRFSRKKDQDALSGVGAALVELGVPAVVAMQFVLSDPGAERFSGAFYTALARRQPIEAAVAEGRMALFTNDPNCIEWAAPVLFLRVPDGRILDLPKEGVVEPKPEQPRPRRIGILSFIGWGYDIKGEADYLLDLTPYFEDRFIRDDEAWQRAIGPQVESFFASTIREGVSHRLEMAAHASIAFAAGYHCEVKAGLDLEIRQRGKRGPEDWRYDEGEVPAGELWTLEEKVLDPQGIDVALGVALARNVDVDVKEYLRTSHKPIRRLILVSLPEVSQTGVLSGAHASKLAEALARLLEKRTAKEREGVLHLFVSGPNAFVFYLGQLAHNFGAVQLYEHAMGSTKAGAYTKSLRLGEG